MTTTGKPLLHRLWHEWAAPLLTVVVVLGSFRSALADWNDVPTGSMRPTILEGDRIFLNKVAYDLRVPLAGWRLHHVADPQRGDIVIFPSPADGRRLVKRVIGLPGDTIELRRDRLLVNGRSCVYRSAHDEDLIGMAERERSGPRFLSETLPGDDEPHIIALEPGLGGADFGPITVPADGYFCMGDNRHNSFDSRFFGMVPRDTIVGQALGVAGSLDPENSYLPRWQRFFSPLR